MSSLSVPLAEKGKQLLTAVHQEPKNIKQLHVLPLLGIHILVHTLDLVPDSEICPCLNRDLSLLSHYIPVGILLNIFLTTSYFEKHIKT